MRYFLALVFTIICSTNVSAAYFVYDGTGSYKTKTTLYKALTDGDTAGKQIINTTPAATLSAPVALSGGRTFECRNGGSVAGSNALTGLPFAHAEWFGATGDGSTNDSAAITRAVAAVTMGGKLYFGEGIFKANFTVGNGVYIVGSGRDVTVFKAQSTSSPIILMNEANSSKYYFIGGSDFSVDGDDTAEIGIQIGTVAVPTGTVTYGSLQRVSVTSCVNNVRLKDTVGFQIDDLYSVSASNAALIVGGTSVDIVTAVTISNSRFRLSKYGIYVDSGAIINAANCVIENNTDYGLFYSRQSDSGARESTFYRCWFEGNGTAHASVASAAGVYIDMLDTLAANKYTSSLVFRDSMFANDADAYDVFLNRGSEILFDNCTFTALTAARLHYESGTGYAYALLKQCGTVNLTASPTVYASFPALTLNAAKTTNQGFRYEYFYQGQYFTNILKPGFRWEIVTGAAIADITGNGATYNTVTLAGASSNSLIYNDGGMFDVTTGTFTAVGPGRYQFDILWPLTDFSAAMTTASVSFIHNATSYVGGFETMKSYAAGDQHAFKGSIILNLAAGDTVKGAITISGGAGNTADLYRAASVFSFSGSQL
jgi:hypothetical protein